MKVIQLFVILLSFTFGGMNVWATTKHGTHKTSSKTHKKSHKKHNYMVGMASFYGEKDGFNGQKMANGEVFNTNSVWSSAHPTLPLGTKLRVTNLENGRSLYVEVTDRMPKSSGRVIDLSKSAALDLGMHKKGLTKVRLEVVSSKTFEERKKYLEVDDNDNGRPY